MMVKDFLRIIEEFANPNLAAEWDNVGFQVGRADDEVYGIVLAMDMDRDTLDFAVKNRANLIITHHPLIFPAISKLTDQDYRSELLMDMISYEMNLIVAHTNLDAALGGVNDVLIDGIGLKPLKIHESEEKNAHLYFRLGQWDKDHSFEEVISKLKPLTHHGLIKVGGKKLSAYTKMAVASGSGSSEIAYAAKQGCQGLITGDVKYHDFQLGRELGITVFDIGHYDSERHVLEKLEEYLEQHSTTPVFVLDDMGFYYHEF